MSPKYKNITSLVGRVLPVSFAMDGKSASITFSTLKNKFAKTKRVNAKKYVLLSIVKAKHKRLKKEAGFSTQQKKIYH